MSQKNHFSLGSKPMKYFFLDIYVKNQLGTLLFKVCFYCIIDSKLNNIN